MEGTGKTSTIAATIEEIVRDVRKHSCVLVCANSNAACDEVAFRLLPVFNSIELLRLYTSSFNPRKIHPRLKQYSNCDPDIKKCIIRELSYLYSFRVVICTLAVAGNLVRANDNPVFKPNHFSHIIIDECASTHETMAIIPIAGSYIFV